MGWKDGIGLGCKIEKKKIVLWGGGIGNGLGFGVKQNLASKKAGFYLKLIFEMDVTMDNWMCEYLQIES